MSIRKAVWCFTHVGGDAEPTSQDGKVVQYGSSHYRVIVGPVEQPDGTVDYPHQHGYIKCQQSRSLTKGQAILLLKQIGMYQDNMYVKELQSTRERYHEYCFKENSGMYSSAERSIKRAWDDIEEADGIKVTAKRLKAKLAKNEGVSFVSKNKQVIETFLATPEIRDSGRKVPVHINPYANMVSFAKIVTMFKKVVGDAIYQEGIVTTHPAYKDSERKDQINAVICTAILPMLVDRMEVTDNIPALWLWGLPHCGKSFLFSQMVNYKKIACDAGGVSRYRLEGDQSGIFIDDVDPGFIFKIENSKTLKALTLGEREVVKINGDTQEVRCFVVLTSNSKPDFLQPYVKKDDDPVDAERAYTYNCNAWKRRFVCIFFENEVEPAEDYVNFDYVQLKLVARRTFEHCFEAIVHEPLRKLFQPYYDHIRDMWTDEEIAVYGTMEEKAMCHTY